MERIVQALTGGQVAQALRDYVMAQRGLDPKTPVAVAVSYAMQDGAVAAAAIVIEDPPTPPPAASRREKAPAGAGETA